MAFAIRLKCYLNDEIQVVNLDTQPTPQHLTEHLSSIFGCPVEVAKYEDHEGDMITAKSENDIQEAFAMYYQVKARTPSVLHTLKLHLRPRLSSNSITSIGSNGSSNGIGLSGGALTGGVLTSPKSITPELSRSYLAFHQHGSPAAVPCSPEHIPDRPPPHFSDDPDSIASPGSPHPYVPMWRTSVDGLRSGEGEDGRPRSSSMSSGSWLEDRDSPSLLRRTSQGHGSSGLIVTGSGLVTSGTRARSSSSVDIFPPPALRTPPPSPGRPQSAASSSASPPDSVLAQVIGRSSDPPKWVVGADLWRKGELLGQGGFGKVYLGMLHSGKLVAVKELELINDSGTEYQKELAEFEHEVDVMKNLSHPNIVRYLGTSRESNVFRIFLELVSGGSIRSIINRFGPLSESITRSYTREILLGLEYLHANNRVHRDIKGANILVDTSGCVKLADFGCAKIVDRIRSCHHHSVKGTPYWMAPEVILGTGHSSSADIWSLGCTVVEMVTGKPPFCEFDEGAAAMFHIGHTKSAPTLPEGLSPFAYDFLGKCFQAEPGDRPTASELLSHPFVTNTGAVAKGDHIEQLKSSFQCETASLLVQLSMSFLPPHLLLHVLSFLPPKSLGVAARVCRDWRKLARDASLWSAYYEERFSFPNNVLEERPAQMELWDQYGRDVMDCERWERSSIQFVASGKGKRTVRCVSVLGNVLISGGSDKKLRLWPLSSASKGRLKSHSHSGHSGAILDLSVDEEHRRVFSASADRTVRVWSVTDNAMKLEGAFRGNARGITKVAAYDGVLACGSEVGDSKVWDVRTQKELYSLFGHSGAITGLAVVEQGLIGSAGVDGYVRLWDPRASNRPIRSLRAAKRGVEVFGLDGVMRRAITLSNEDHQLQCWDLVSAKSASVVDGSSISTFQCSERLIVAARSDGSIRVQQPFSHDPLAEYATRRRTPMGGIALNGQYIASWAEKEVYVYGR